MKKPRKTKMGQELIKAADEALAIERLHRMLALLEALPQSDVFLDAHVRDLGKAKDLVGKVLHHVTRSAMRTKGEGNVLEIASGIYVGPRPGSPVDQSADWPGGITETVDLQSGNSSEDCWIFEAPKKWDGKKVKLVLVEDV